MNVLKFYTTLWLRLARLSFYEVWATRINSLGWLAGKVVRLVFFFVFILAIFRHTDSLKGYRLPETILFFLTFNLVDLIAQLLFRGIYGIKRILNEGEMDYYLLQPASVLFRVVSQSVDFLDFATAIPVAIASFWAIGQLPAEILTFNHIALYVLLIANGVAIAFAIHVAVASAVVITQQLDNAIWVYRDLMILGRFPVDIYSPGVQAALTFIIPVAVMTSFPAKALLGLLSWEWVFFAMSLAGLSVWLSLKFWHYALSQYSSVSS